jgi:hypothetical protein
MATIKCRTPSTGKPLSIRLDNVPITFTNIAESPDFSVPDAAGNFPERDDSDNTRAIRPGEVFFLTPMSVRNKSNTRTWIETQLVTESNTTIQFGRVSIPAGDTGFIPLQGRSIFKRDASSSNGDIIQVRAESSNALDIWVAAEEKLSSEHIGEE